MLLLSSAGGDKATKKPLPSDVDQGRTVFIRCAVFLAIDAALYALQGATDYNAEIKLNAFLPLSAARSSGCDCLMRPIAAVL